MSETLLRDTVFKVLLSQSATRMDFWAHGMHVNAGGYGMVSYYIWNGIIRVRLARRAGQMTAGAEAEYQKDERTIMLPRDPYGVDAKERGAIVHECTHALRHVLFSSPYSKEGGPRHDSNMLGQLHFDNEAVAYIAGSLYHLYETKKDWADLSPVIREANVIARTLEGKVGATVDEGAFATLRLIVSQTPPHDSTALLSTPDDETWK